MNKSKKKSFNFWNPFEKLAGFKAFVIGLAGVLVSVLMGTMFNARFDGLLNLHFVANADFLLVLSDQLINLITATVCFYAMAMLLSLGKVRFIDFLGCFSLALTPMAVLPLVNISGYWSDLTVEIAGKPDMTPRALSNLDSGVMVFTVLLAIIILTWHIIWLYNAYRVSSGFKGNRLIYSFIITLVGALFLSKFIITSL